MDSRFLSGISLDANGARTTMYFLASIPVRRQQSIVPSLTPPSVPRPMMPMTAATITMMESEVMRTLP